MSPASEANWHRACSYVGADGSNLAAGTVGVECVPQVATVRCSNPSVGDVCIIDKPSIPGVQRSGLHWTVGVRPALGEEVRDE